MRQRMIHGLAVTLLLAHFLMLTGIGHADAPASWDSFTVTSPDGTVVPAVWVKPDAQEPFPILVFFHGAPGGQGIESLQDRTGAAHWQRFLEAGIAVCLSDYRAHEPGKPFDVFRGDATAVDDALAVIRYLQAQDGLDPQQVIPMGQSLGGVIVLYALSRASFACAIVSAAASLPILQPKGWDGMRSTQQELRDDQINKPHAVAVLEPITTPLLMVQGTKDGLSVLNRKIYTLMQAMHKPVRLELFEGQGHPFINQDENPATQRAWSIIRDFVKQHVAGADMSR